MNGQPSFADLDCQSKRRRTRREEFLERMDSLIPWRRLEERIGPCRFRGERGRRPCPLPGMLRVHVVQLCYNLSGPVMEDLPYEAEPVRRFAGLRLPEPVPDESAILHFRRLPERRQLGQGLFEEIKERLAEQGVRLREGTIVDAAIIEAPSSTKKRQGRRDPEMREVKKGNQYCFGMKLHTGVDADAGQVHSLRVTSANVHDVAETHQLLHGGERRVWGDAGYTGVRKRKENLGLAVDWQAAMKPGQRRKLAPDSWEAMAEKVKAPVRAKAEHPFLDVKQMFGYAKLRCRGLSKNQERLALLLGLSNLKRAQAFTAG